MITKSQREDATLEWLAELAWNRAPAANSRINAVAKTFSERIKDLMRRYTNQPERLGRAGAG